MVWHLLPRLCLLVALVPGVAGATPLPGALRELALGTVTTQDSSDSFDPSTPTTSFVVSFPFISKDHLVVTHILEAGSVETPLTHLEHYSVTLPIQGTACTTVAPPCGQVTLFDSITTGEQLRIERVVPATQELSLRNQGTIYPYQVEQALDLLTMLAQQILAEGGSDGAAAVATHVAQSDPHTQYFKLTGRSGGQTAYGGTGNGQGLTLDCNIADGLGDITLGGGLTAVDCSDGHVGVGTAPDSSYELSIGGGGLLAFDELILQGADTDDTGVRHRLANDLVIYAGGPSLSAVGVTAAGMRVYGSTHATLANNLHLYADELRIAVETGTTNWTFTSGLLTAAAGVDLVLSATSFLNTPFVNGGADSGDDLQLNSTQHATKGLILFGSSSAFDDVNERIGIGTTGPAYAVDAVGYVKASTGFITGAGTLTCADNGAGTAAACTATSAEVLGLIEITCNDAHGCELTVDETSAVTGTQVILSNVGTNTVTVIDVVGGQETAPAVPLGQYDTATLTYGTGRWYQTAASNN